MLWQLKRFRLMSLYQPSPYIYGMQAGEQAVPVPLQSEVQQLQQLAFLLDEGFVLQTLISSHYAIAAASLAGILAQQAAFPGMLSTMAPSLHLLIGMACFAGQRRLQWEIKGIAHCWMFICYWQQRMRYGCACLPALHHRLSTVASVRSPCPDCADASMFCIHTSSSCVCRPVCSSYGGTSRGSEALPCRMQHRQL